MRNCVFKIADLIILSLFLTVNTIHAQTLTIQPFGPKIEKEVGENLALTCRPNTTDPGQVTNLEWLDPEERIIKVRETGAPIYVQNLSAEKGSVLIFNGLKQNQEGKYTCRGRYANTVPMETSVTVETYEGVTFVDAPTDQYPVVGGNYLVRCKVKGKPAPTVDWHRDERDPITNTDKYVVMPDGLLINNVSEADDGDYKCTAVVEKTGVFKVRNIKVEVQVPPKIDKMMPVSVVEGETASVKCTATGKPPPTYQWIKMRERQDLSKTDRFSVQALTGHLIINRVEFNDNGVYQCFAENSAGRVGTTVKINVLVKPKIYELLNATAPIKQETTLTCKVYGRPPPKVIFRKLSNVEPFRLGQQDDKRIIVEQQFFEDKGETFATLTITNLSRKDDGLYECIAENSAGTAYKNGHITVQFPPTFARTRDLPPVWTWDNKPGNLSCLPEAIPNATIVWRLGDIEINEENFRNKRIHDANFKVEGNGPQSFLIVKPYSERSYYTQYECIARNNLGEASMKIWLREAHVPGQPAQVGVATLTATTVKFDIIPPTNYDGLPIRSFTVQYKPEQQLSWDYATNHTWSYGAPYILEGLIPEVTYHLRFAARNDVGLGPYFNARSITMPRRSEPNEPRILVTGGGFIGAGKKNEQTDGAVTGSRSEVDVVSPYSDHYELRWNVPADNGDPIQHYLIRYCVSQRVNGAWLDTDCSEQFQQSFQYTSYQLDNLRPDTVYKIELRAHNAIGDSAPAQLRVRTARGIGPVVPLRPATMSSSVIVGIVVAALILVLLVVDLTCFLIHRTGLIALCCEKARTKKTIEEDTKFSRDETEPLKVAPEEKTATVEFDGRHVYSRTGEVIGKHSAV